MTTQNPSAACDGLPSHPFAGALARAAGLAACAALVLAPPALRAAEPEVTVELTGEVEAGAGGADVVAEALFLYDALPPGSRDLNLSFELAEGEADPATGETRLVASPTLQLAAPLGDRLGMTLDVGLDTVGDVTLDAPGASLKLLLREPGAGRTGLAASFDLFGSTHSLRDGELGLGLGAIHGLGPVGLRAAASLATGLSSWTPHLHGGLSAAVALGDRLCALAEVVADVSSAETVVSVGPTLKLAVGERVALMAGALFQVASAASPVFTVQLTQRL